MTVLPRTFKEKYISFQTEQEISSLPEHIKLCKFFIAKRISYIISWKFAIHEFDRIKYLSKEILIKGWSPALREATASKQPPPKGISPSRGELKRRLEKALLEIDKNELNEQTIV